MPCPSARRSGQAPEQTRRGGRRGGPWGGLGASPRRSWSPARPAAGLAEPEQQEKLTFTGARGLRYGFISEFLLEIAFFWFFFWSISSMRKKKHILLPLSFRTRSSGMWFGCLIASHHPEPPWGSCHPLRLTVGSGTGQGTPVPQSLQALQHLPHKWDLSQFRVWRGLESSPACS